jgi:cytochrome c oxidase subunit 3
MHSDPHHDPAEKFHPKQIVLTLLLTSLTVLFVALSVAYVYSRVQYQLPPVRLPWLFFFNTLILIGSHWTLSKAFRAYTEDDTEEYRRQLSATLLLSVVFLLLQGLAWAQLYQDALLPKSDLSTSYMYALSILHFLHVIGGIPFLVAFTLTAYTRMREPVSVLLYFADPDKRRHLRLLIRYWQFLGLLWVYLLLFLGVNMFF